MNFGKLSRGVCLGALSLALACAATARAQEALPTIDIAGAGSANGAPASGREEPAKETGYRRSNTVAATRTDTPLLKTPVAVQIVPREVLEDKQILNTMEAVKNVSGVQAQPGTFYDQYRIRGFNSGYGLTYRNGLQMRGILGSEDVAFTDRVEIVKGPSSVLYGRMEPGGFVNVVTKKPQEVFHAGLQQQVGNFGLARTSVDVGGPVDDAKTVLFRFMGAYDRADSFTDFDHRDNGALALFLTFRPTENFEFNAQFEHYEKKQTSPSGSGQIPVVQYDGNGNPIAIRGFSDRPLGLPRSFSVSDPIMWSDFPYTVHRSVYAYDWTYRFDDRWKLTNNFHYVESRETQTMLATAFLADERTIRRRFIFNPLERNIVATNLNLIGDVEIGPTRHKLLAGVDWFSYVDNWGPQNYIGGVPFIPPLDIYAPTRGNLASTLYGLKYEAALNYTWRERDRDFGVYAQDQISLFDDRLHILLGGRWDKAEVNQAETYGFFRAPCYPACTGYPLLHLPDSPKLSPRAAVLYKLMDNVSVYGGYVRSFGQSNGANLGTGARPVPEAAVQWEAGVKSQWLDGRVTASATYFNLRRKNILENDPLNPGFMIAVGEVESEGLELDVAGQVTDNLSLIGSYTYDVAKVTKDDNGNRGHGFNGVAPHVGNLWAKWDTAPGLPEGFELGGGVYAMSWRWGDDANSWILPGYARLDAMAAWRTLVDGHKVSFRLNVKNLSDTKYFEYSDAGFNAYYGAPRAFIGSVSVQF
jgi:iron complex outermembrane receptor protein